MRTAFKEWAIVVDALGRGAQILILRKGGLREGSGGFRLEQRQFLLFPTLFHQQRASVLPAAQSRFDEIEPHFPPSEVLRFQYFATLVAARKVNSLAGVAALRGQHIWRDEVIADRFSWGPEGGIFALAVRVFRLPQPVDIPLSAAYGGCKSWIETEVEVPVAGAIPVLSNVEFARALARFENALTESPVLELPTDRRQSLESPA